MTPRARTTIRAAAAALLVAVAAACASVQKPQPLTEAEATYQRLATAGATQRVEADMLRAETAIKEAQEAVAGKRHKEYVAGLAHIAMRRAQAADANDARVLAGRAADSLRTARLRRLLSMSEAQRNQLQAQQRLSQSAIDSLRVREDSLRLANDVTTLRADSLRRAGEESAARADSLQRVATEASARLNEALSRLRSLVSEITSLRETSRGIVISLSDILFDVNRATLRRGAEQNVRRIAEILKQYPDKQIVVEGHTDATGSDAYNQRLSEERAASVRSALIAGGVVPGAITSRGFGKAQPVASNGTAEGRQQNRRVEVIVLGAGKVADAERARQEQPAMPAPAPATPPATQQQPPR